MNTLPCLPLKSEYSEYILLLFRWFRVRTLNADHGILELGGPWWRLSGAAPSQQVEVNAAQRAARTFGRLNSKAQSSLDENSDFTSQLLTFPTVLDQKFFRAFHLFNE